jgi:hypothetical protein
VTEEVGFYQPLLLQGRKSQALLSENSGEAINLPYKEMQNK